LFAAHGNVSATKPSSNPNARVEPNALISVEESFVRYLLLHWNIFRRLFM